MTSRLVVFGPPSHRFWAHVTKTENCWTWDGAKSKGYGHFNDGTRVVQAHRWSYESALGPIPAGLQLDHLCRNHSCVRPDHLEPVTLRENLIRGIGFSAINAQKTHCPQGHALDGLKKDGRRYCLTCNRMRNWRNRR